MNRATLAALAVTLFAGARAAGPASGQISIEPVRGCAGHLSVSARTGASRWVPAAPAAPAIVTTDVYQNLTSPGNFGVASSDPHAVWGDSLTISQAPGIVEAITVTVLNSSISLGNTNQVQLLVTLRDAATGIDLANYVFGATFDGGLPPGFYALVSITDLSSSPLPLTVSTRELVIQQTVTSSIGSSRLGVVSLAPPTIGTSGPWMYVSALDAFGGVAGFHAFAPGPADPGYELQMNVDTPATPVSWGRVKELYR